MEDIEAVNLAADWSDISQGLRKDLGHQLHSQWIKPIQVGGFCKDTGTLDLFLPTDFSANWVQDRFADRLSLAWKIARSEVRNVRIAGAPRSPQAAGTASGRADRRPMTAALAWQCGAASGGGHRLHPWPFRPGWARPVADLRRVRHGRSQCAGLQRGAAHGRQRNAAILTALSERRDRPGQDASDACHRPCLSGASSPRADLLLQRRTLHGAIRAGAEIRPDDGIQDAPAQFRPAAGGRSAIHHRQGQRAGRTALHDRRAAGRGQAAGLCRRPRSAGAGRGRTALAQPSVDGSRRRYPASRYRAAARHPGSPAYTIRPARLCRPT